MSCNILSIADAFIEPPSEPLALRTVTMISAYDLHLDIVFQTTQEMKDFYYKWMKPKGLMDYVKDILNEREFERGIHLDTVGKYPMTVVVKYVRYENQLLVLGEIKTIAGKLQMLSDSAT